MSNYVRFIDRVATEITESDFRVAFPNIWPISSEAQINAYNVYTLNVVTQPAYDEATQNLAYDGPVETTPGVWEQSWSVTTKTTQEQDDYQRQQEIVSAQAALLADAEVTQLLSATPTQIDNYIDTNVTDLASARDVLKRVARATAVIGAPYIDQ